MLGSILLYCFEFQYLIMPLFRSSRQEVRYKKGVRWPTILLKQSLRYRCFPVNFTKFLRTPFLLNTSGNYFWLLEAVPQNQQLYCKKPVKIISSFHGS